MWKLLLQKGLWISPHPHTSFRNNKNQFILGSLIHIVSVHSPSLPSLTLRLLCSFIYLTQFLKLVLRIKPRTSYILGRDVPLRFSLRCFVFPFLCVCACEHWCTLWPWVASGVSTPLPPCLEAGPSILCCELQACPSTRSWESSFHLPSQGHRGYRHSHCCVPLLQRFCDLNSGPYTCAPGT